MAIKLHSLLSDAHPTRPRRLSGAFAASMRRQSLAPGSSGDPPASPFALSPLIQSDGEEEADVSLLEQNDDEYAAREQAQL